MGNNKTVVVNYDNLDKHIKELNTLESKVNGFSKSWPDLEENGGKTVTELVKMAKTINEIQDALALLIRNTSAYLKGRETAFKEQDAKAAAEVSAK